ncbi:hypothetical protein [Spirochaeta africana]|uniref:Polymerase beta nucleotidyltransferase domain-containing protein n=1 Tax=Spirochaeta africana (strain ATCC 700263 / DSM 8902 / Z-7692) TaxID=889378 RepID=H9UIG7_SPIAZ|nr:hypothetical protein [Spirochaeta africana]AFG37310.1 hypothetical protein Spiaf_1233 [Spirochaeta africana DSM 8902]
MDDIATIRQFAAERRQRKLQAAAERRKTFEAVLPHLLEGILGIDPDVELVILFGSMARPDDVNVGDIDIALRSSRFLKVAGWLLRQDVPVDVVDIDDVYDHIRDRIMAQGRVLYERG